VAGALRGFEPLVILAALPALAFILTTAYFGAAGEWRVAFLKAGVVYGLVVVANTEVLSLVGVLGLPALLAVWALVSGVAALGVWQRRHELAAQLRVLSSYHAWHPHALAVAPVLVIIAATGVIALIAPPNTWDSMSYHVARVAHWVADGTVAFYPTNVIRQLYSPPWSEYAVLQFQLLSGNDQLANLVQWFSMVGSTVLASLIAQQLGSPARGQLLTAIVVATLPMGILQASSTQTDYVVAFWLVCSVSFALSFLVRSTPQRAAWLGSSLGLALLSKGTAYLFAAPIVVMIGFYVLRRFRAALVPQAVLLLVIPLVINSGYYLRNESLFHNPLGTNSESAQLVNTSFSPQAVASNAVRDAIMQFGTPNPKVNQWLERGIAKVHSGVLRFGLNDPATTWPGATFHINPLSFDEDYAGDPLQAALAIAAVLAAIGLAFRRGPPLILIYSLGLVLAFVAFAAYLRWQPWHTRLELPLLVLSAPLIGAVAARVSNAQVMGAVAAVLVIASVPWLVDNQTRPMVGFALPESINTQPRYLPAGDTIFNTPRIDLYFAKRPALKAPYETAMARAAESGCREVALWSGTDDWEYPLWVLASKSEGAVRVDQVHVDNESINAHRFGSRPCLLVVLVSDQPPAVAIDGVEFRQTWSREGVGLYEPSPAGS
jgi:hypothetical protein